MKKLEQRADKEARHGNREALEALTEENKELRRRNKDLALQLLALEGQLSEDL